jgi:hypothetical protein
MSDTFVAPQFQIIRRRGMPMYAYLPNGTRVERSLNDSGFEALFVPELRGFVRCASYSDHFIYEIPSNLAYMYPGAVYRCTCGSAAIYAGVSGYIADASPQGKLFVCQMHSIAGYHATGGAKWV